MEEKGNRTALPDILVVGIAGGSGGGKPDSAMGGGKDAAKVDEALSLVEDFVSAKV